jgi:phage/plasmid primase-like uncharacterized protein
MACCPVTSHGQGRGDHNPSLSVTPAADGSALVHCFAGCSLGDILAALDLPVGALFDRADNQPHQRQRRALVASLARPPAPDEARLAGLHARYRRGLSPASLAHLAHQLGLRATSLDELELGWDQSSRAWTFPMRDGDGRLVGFRLRLPDGRKLTAKGTHAGLFIPTSLKPGARLLIAEGPTDTAALLDMDLPAVGRPSCTGGVGQIARLLRRVRFTEIIIAADRDDPGQRGAQGLADTLLQYLPVRIITPPGKDVREWLVKHRATASDVVGLIEEAPLQRLEIAIGEFPKLARRSS